jgi:hypothetical protein
MSSTFFFRPVFASPLHLFRAPSSPSHFLKTIIRTKINLSQPIRQSKSNPYRTRLSPYLLTLSPLYLLSTTFRHPIHAESPPSSDSNHLGLPSIRSNNPRIGNESDAAKSGDDGTINSVSFIRLLGSSLLGIFCGVTLMKGFRLVSWVILAGWGVWKVS